MLYDIFIEIKFTEKAKNQFKVRTNTKKKALEGILDTWLSMQMEKGEDNRKRNELDTYTVTIQVDLSYDTFNTISNTGNDGLTTGIVLAYAGKLYRAREAKEKRAKLKQRNKKKERMVL